LGRLARGRAGVETGKQENGHQDGQREADRLLHGMPLFFRICGITVPNNENYSTGGVGCSTSRGAVFRRAEPTRFQGGNGNRAYPKGWGESHPSKSADYPPGCFVDPRRHARISPVCNRRSARLPHTAAATNPEEEIQ